MAKTLAVALYMETQVLTGFINHDEERLSDVLNGVSLRREHRGRFVELSYVNIQNIDGPEESLAISYINKATIQVATTIDGDLAKGIGGRVGVKPYPFIEKLPVLVKVRMPAYIVIGNLHCASRQMARHTLEEKPVFLPLTNVNIRRSNNSHWWKASFAIVNTEQILSWQEEDAMRSCTPG